MGDWDRDRLRRAIFARCKAIGFDDEDRRAVQFRAIGRESISGAGKAELRAVLEALGGSAPRPDSLPRHAMASVVRALWISGWNLGVVRDRTDAALCRFVAQAAGVSRARFAGPRMAVAVEEAKRMLARDAGVDWSPVRLPGGAEERRPKVRVLEAQWRILDAAGAAGASLGEPWEWVCSAAGLRPRPLHELSAAEADRAISALGEIVRRAGAA